MELFVVCVAHWNHRLAFFSCSIFDFWFALGFCALQWYYNAYWVVVYLGCFSFWLDRQTGMISRWASFFDSFNPRWSWFSFKAIVFVGVSSFDSTDYAYAIYHSFVNARRVCTLLF